MDLAESMFLSDNIRNEALISPTQGSTGIHKRKNIKEYLYDYYD